jgi:protein gp37
MAETSTIAWTHATFNPWIGCSKIAPGCTNCYAAAYANRYGKAHWGPNGTRVKTSPTYWKQPLKWNRQAEQTGERRRVFTASLADVFEDWDGPILNHKGQRLYSYVDVNASAIDGSTGLTMSDLRRDLFALIDATPHLDWLLLTKRPENIRKMWPYPNRYGSFATGISPQVLYRDNVWLLTSIATQADADRNIPELLKCRDLSPVLGVSAEPLIDAVDFTLRGSRIAGWDEDWKYDTLTGDEWASPRDDSEPSSPRLDWVIVGGESGPNRRDCGIEPLCDLATQCLAAGVPVFVKQDCALHSGEQGRIPDDVWALKQFPEVRTP